MKIRINRQSQSLQSWHSDRRGAMGCGLLIPLFLGAIFGIVGLCIILFLGWPVLQNAKASQQWPSTKGAVTASEVIRSRSDDGVQYKPEILYNYRVGKEDYQQGNIRYDGDWSTSSSTYANRMVQKYPVGKQVDVYYDPDDPFEAVLEPGTSWASYSLIGFGLIFFLIGAGMFLGTGGYLLFAMFVAGRSAGSKTGNSSSSQNRFQDDNPYANTDKWEDNKQDDFDSGSSTGQDSYRDHDDGFENL